MRTLLTIVAAAGALALAPAAHAQSAPGFKVVVNAENPIESIPRERLSHIFLKKTTMWARNRPVAFVDQTPTSPVRSAFTRSVHKREISSIQSYWQTMIFSGRGVPAAEKRSDADVLAFVAATRDGVGYVAADAPLGAQVKAVRIE